MALALPVGSSVVCHTRWMFATSEVVQSPGKARLMHPTPAGRELLAAQEHCTDHGPNTTRITHRLEELGPPGALDMSGWRGRREGPSQPYPDLQTF